MKTQLTYCLVLFVQSGRCKRLWRVASAVATQVVLKLGARVRRVQACQIGVVCVVDHCVEAGHAVALVHEVAEAERLGLGDRGRAAVAGHHERVHVKVRLTFDRVHRLQLQCYVT